jgi:hypothetical protein
MPCYRCGTRQVDPDRGESPWQRGVRGDRQVLICPACQESPDWRAELDGCGVCTGVHLVRRLGETECRDCGWVRPAAPAGLPGHLAALAPAAGRRPPGLADPPPAPDGDLAREVERALARVLGRTAGSAARS